MGLEGQKMRSQTTKKLHKPHVAKKTMRALLDRSVALLSCLFPPPTLSVVDSESATNCEILADCMSKFWANCVWSSEISNMLCSAVLRSRLSDHRTAKPNVGTYRTWSIVSSYCFSISLFSFANNCNCSGLSCCSISRLAASSISRPTALPP